MAMISDLERRAIQRRVDGAARPLAGTTPWDDPMSDTAYEDATAAIAKAYLLLTDANDPGLLWKANSHDLYRAVCQRWPGYDKWIGGARNTMVAIALMMARAVRTAK